LQAFINQVQAQRGKKITTAAADALIAQAQAVITQLTPTPPASSTVEMPASSTVEMTPTPTPSPTGTMTPTPLAYLPGNVFAASLKLPSLSQFRSDAPVSLSQQQSTSMTIDYAYDPLYRLIKADYSNGDLYQYTYDSVGNRLAQESVINGLPSTANYSYDSANRLSAVNGVAHAFDPNGNLLSDGVSTYTYDAANRLGSVTSDQNSVTSYAYNGLGDRLQETAAGGVTTTFTMDLNTGLTQALDDGTNTYLYGLGRLAQLNTGALDTEYYLTDALGSVRQLTDSTGAITLARTYDPYGVVTAATGPSASGYGFTGEYQSADLVYLRARHYAPGMGRFLTRDTWPGQANRPLSLNRWGYVEGNPVNLTDETGMHPGYHSNYCDPLTGTDRRICEKIVRGFPPNAPFSTTDLRLYDICTLGLGDGCACDELLLTGNPLHVNLEHSLSLGMGDEYGWWWYYLLNSAPGFWNNHGNGHTSFKTALAFALGAELGNEHQYAGLGDMMAEATARKGWGEGFFRLIGGRQSVQMRVNDVLYSGGLYRITDKNFTSLLSKFAEVIQRDFNEYPINNVAFPLVYKIFNTTAWREGVKGNTPYEWGNPTPGSPRKLLEKLSSFDNMHDRSDGIYWFSHEWKKDFPTTTYKGIVMYQLAFVITRDQIAETCDNGSCVQP
jgi:RHS repeat-associated protein